MKPRMLLSPSWKKSFLCGKEKPNVELLREIIESDIFPRLPAESLGRCMCVCKQWKSHISTSEFIRKHINNESLNRKVLEIDYSSQTFTTRDLDDLNNHDSTIVRSIPFFDEAQEVLLLASLDGLVFVKLLNTCEYAFWNPLTGAYKKLSNSPKQLYLPFDAFGLYFDSKEKDYKVLQLSCVGSGSFKAVIYSQRLNSTKEIQWLGGDDQRLSSSFWSTPIYFGESLYFIGKSSSVAYRDKFWIIVFDVKSENIREIRFPLLNQENPYYYESLMVIKGCIHLFVTRARCMKEGGELWRMDDDSENWTKVKDFPPARNHPWTYDDEKIHMEDLALKFNSGEPRRKILYVETLVSPSC
ncbi:F-box domain containing protein [Tanacetum coccineum]